MPQLARTSKMNDIVELNTPAPPPEPDPEAPSREAVIASGKDLLLGLGARLLIKSSQFPENIKSEVIGLARNEFIIVRMPLISGFRTHFAEGEQLIVRYLAEGAIYGFKTTLLRLQVKPAPMFFIEYPYTIEKIELRRYKRAACLIPSKLHCRYGELHGVVVDLSGGGCKLSLDLSTPDVAQLAIEDMIILECALVEAGSSTMITSVLRSIANNGKKLTLGLQFKDLDQETRSAITGYIEQLESFAQAW